VTVRDVSERKHAGKALRASEERQKFLLKLSDALRPLSDPQEVKAVATRLLGEQLGVNRVFYADAYDDRWLVTTGYNQGVGPLPDGPYPMAAYGQSIHDGFHAGQPLVVREVTTDARFQPAERAALAALQITGAAAVPLVKDGALVAMVALHTGAPRNWTVDEIALLDETAERTWAAVERARIEAALRESRAKLASELEDAKQLKKISSLLIEDESGAGFYEHILDAAVAIMRADCGSIQMLDSERGELRLLGWRNFHPESAEYWQKVSVKTGTSYGSALQHGERFIVPDVNAADFLQNTEGLRHYRLSGITAVQSTPLTTRDGQLIGMISTHWRQRHEPSERDLALLDVLARQAADVLERRRVQEGLRASKSWLAGQKEAFEAAIHGAPLEESLGLLVRTALKHAGEDVRCAFYIADRAEQRLRHVTGMSESYSECVDGFKIGPDSLACGLAVFTGQPVITPDVTEAPPWKPWLWLAKKYEYRACWSFPIETSSGKAIGTFAMYFKLRREATQRDYEFAAILTRAAAIIISRHQEAEERVRVEAALRESESKLAIELADTQILQRLSSILIQEDNIDTLYDQILEAARALMRSDFASLQRLVPERNALLLLAQKGFAPQSAAFWKWVELDHTSSCGLAMSSGERVIIPDVERWDFVAGTENLAQYRLSGIRAMQSTRLIIGAASVWRAGAVRRLEAVAAAAGVDGVRVEDREAALHQVIDVVDLGAVDNRASRRRQLRR
jgi:GAF domain-containing protein